MTGTGTKDDPFIVDNEVDLRNAIQQDGKYVECVSGLVIDYNTNPSVSEFIIKCSSIEGKGLIIKNARFSSKIISVNNNTCEISNVNIIDCACLYNAALSITGNDWTHHYVSFTNCNFKLTIHKQFAYSYVNNVEKHFIFRSCNFTIYTIGDIVLCYSNTSSEKAARFYDCIIYIENNHPFACLYCSLFDTCYICGKFDGADGGCQFLYCIIEAESDNFKTYSSTTTFDSSVYNSDIITPLNSVNGLSPLTSSEIRNSQKLFECGIPVNPTGG